MIEVDAAELVPGEQIYIGVDGNVPVSFLSFDSTKGILNFEYGDGEEDWVLADNQILVDRT